MRNKQRWSAALAIFMAVSSFTPVMATTASTDLSIKQQVLESVVGNEMSVPLKNNPDFKAVSDTSNVRVIVELENKPVIDYAIEKGLRVEDLNKSFVSSLTLQLETAMDQVLSTIESKNIEMEVHNQFVNVFNGFSATVSKSDALVIESLPNVKSVSVSAIYERPEVTEPNMNTSIDMVNAQKAWALKYKGEGMVVAVLDSSFAPDHVSMQKITNVSKAAFKGAVDLPNGKPTGEGEKLFKDFYRNVKMPFGYNYYDHTGNLAATSEHGTHVAGTVAANGDPEEGGIVGVAPEAQVLGMKVFGDDPSISTTFDDVYVAAIEDAITLGADAINMSLGSTSSFLQDEAEDPARVAIRKASESGIVVSVSAGNSNKFGDGFNDPYVTNPDYGVVGSPSLNPYTLSVASAENTHVTKTIANLKIGDVNQELLYNLAGALDPVEITKGVPQEVIYVGTGEPQFYTEDVKGKFVFAVRTGGFFYEKIKLEAQKQGAAGVIVRGAVGHGDFVNMGLGTSATLIPMMSTSIAAGNALEAEFKANKKVTVTFAGQVTQVENGNSGKMSDFTSWGMTPNLDFKPEITAPGGQIYSTLQNNKYGSMSGTSMAAPHVAGGTALVMERIDKEFALQGIDRYTLAKNLLMSTAKPHYDVDGKEFTSPRRQGAGMMDLYAATVGKAFAVDPVTNIAKVNLKEIKTDKVSFDVKVTNKGTAALTYDLGATIATDAVYEGRVLNMPQSINDAVVEFKKGDAPITTITVAAESSEVFTVVLDLSKAKVNEINEDESLTAKGFKELFANGGFVEGFVRLKDSKNPELSIGLPYSGFYGDWNKPSVLDVALYDQTETVKGFYGSAYNALYTEAGTKYPFLGGLYGKTEYDKTKIAISPNGDGYGDLAASYFTFLRNAKTLEVNILDADKKVVRTLSQESYVRKNFYDGDPKKPKAKDFAEWDGKIDNAVVEGQYYYQIKSTIDFPGAAAQVYEMPITVDNTEPAISNIVYDKVKDTVTITATDNHAVKSYHLYIDGVEFKTLDSKNVDNPADNQTGVFAVAGKVVPGTVLTALAVDYAYNVKEVEKTIVGEIVNDNKAPEITLTTPAAFDVAKTNAVTFAGEIIEPTGLKSLTIDGKKVDFTYDSEKKVYNYSTVLNYADGRYSVKVVAVDLANNSYTFERKFYVDSAAPVVTLVEEPAATVEDAVKTVVLKGVVKDNYSGINLSVNGSVLANVSGVLDVKTPVEISKSFEHTVNLKYGKNTIIINARDGADNLYTKTYEVYRKQIGGIMATATPGKNVSSEVPVAIKATGDQAGNWKVLIMNPLNQVEATLTQENAASIDKTWAPDEGRKLNGTYEAVIEYTVNTVTKTERVSFEVYNYGMKIEKLNVVKRNQIVSVEADVLNISPTDKNPMLVVQVTNDQGKIVNISTATINGLKSTQKVTLTSGFALENGVYKVEAFIWTGWDNTQSLGEMKSTKFIAE